MKMKRNWVKNKKMKGNPVSFPQKAAKGCGLKKCDIAKQTIWDAAWDSRRFCKEIPDC